MSTLTSSSSFHSHFSGFITHLNGYANPLKLNYSTVAHDTTTHSQQEPKSKVQRVRL